MAKPPYSAVPGYTAGITFVAHIYGQSISDLLSDLIAYQSENGLFGSATEAQKTRKLAVFCKQYNIFRMDEILIFHKYINDVFVLE